MDGVCTALDRGGVHSCQRVNDPVVDSDHVGEVRDLVGEVIEVMLATISSEPHSILQGRVAVVIDSFSSAHNAFDEVFVRRNAGVDGWRRPGDGDMDGGSNASW